MYIVIFGDKRDGYFGPFETQLEGHKYINVCGGYGKVVHLVKPYALGKIEEEENEVEASEQGGT